MHKIVLDTSVYIPLLRDGKMPGAVIESVGSVLYLSSVVAQELYAGAIDKYSIRILDELCSVFHKHDRIITPALEDWFAAGRVLARIGQRQGFESIKKGRLVNDVLIALSCKKIEAVLLTANHRDFKLINEVAKFQFVGV